MEWRTIDEFPFHEISEDGQVKTKEKLQTRPKGYMLKGSYTHDGYKIYKLINKNHIKVRMTAHRLVSLAFIGEPPTKIHQVAHHDGNRANNHFNNLRWATPYENNMDKFIHGTTGKGSKNPRALLNENQVREIRKRYTGKYGEITKFAREYGVSHTAMFQVVHNIQWRDII